MFNKSYGYMDGTVKRVLFLLILRFYTRCIFKGQIAESTQNNSKLGITTTSSSYHEAAGEKESSGKPWFRFSSSSGGRSSAQGALQVRGSKRGEGGC